MSALAFLSPASSSTSSAAAESERPVSRTSPTTGRSLPLVGREAELAALARLFERGVRLVTLSGAPGVGKSALARAFAFASEDRAAKGSVILVDLSEARNDEEARELVGRTLGLLATDEATFVSGWAAHLASRPSTRWVVVDGGDAAMRTASCMMQVVLSRSPESSDVKMLFTARTTLGLEEERCLTVGALDTTPRAVGLSPAAELLVSRSSVWTAPEVSTDDERASLEGLAARADGLPIALEAIATRLHSHDIGSVAAWFARPEAVLSASRSGGTVADVIAPAWLALSHPERADLFAVATFAGAFDVHQAELVLAPSEVSVQSRLLDLVERHLVIATAQDAASPLSFSMLSPIRAFVRSREPEIVDAKQTFARHDAHFLAAAANVSLSFVYTLEAEETGSLDDLLEAVDRALATSNVDDEAALETLLRSMSGLAAAALEPATASFAAARFERAAPRVTMASEDVRARFWLAWGALRRVSGQPLEAEQCYAAARESSTELEVRMIAEVARAAVLGRMGQTREAEQALARPLSGRESPIRAEALRVMATIRAIDGRAQEAELLAREAFRTHVGLEHDPRPAFVILLGVLLSENGRFAEGRAHLEAARAGYLAAGRARWVALCDTNLASSALDEKDTDLAIERYKAAYEAFYRESDWLEAGVAAGYWGVALLLSGQPQRAIERLQRGIELCDRVAAQQRARLFRGCLAVALVTLDRSETALARAGALLVGATGNDELVLLTEAVAVLSAGRDEKPLALRRAGAATARVTSTPGSSFVRRLSLRILEHTVREEARRDDRVLRVAEDGSWFEGEDGIVDLTTRAPLRGILVALARAAQTSPGALVTAQELIAAGWPGERILQAAARGRLRVAMCTLRKFGLRDFLSSSRHGHTLAARVDIAPGAPRSGSSLDDTSSGVHEDAQASGQN